MPDAPRTDVVMVELDTVRLDAGLPEAVRGASARTLDAGRCSVVPGRCWLVANALAVAAVGAAYGDVVAVAPLVAWSAFVVLNAGLVITVGAGRLPGFALGARAGLNAGLAGVTGVAWGAGVAALLPLAGAAEAGVLLCAALSVAFTAIPALGAARRAYGAFLVPLAVFALIGVISDSRYALTAFWLVPAVLTMLMLGSVYVRTYAGLREIVDGFLGATDAAGADGSAYRHADAELAALARSRLAAYAEAARMVERHRRVLCALGDGVVTTDAAGAIEFLNPVAGVLLGGNALELRGKRIEECLRLVFPPDPRNETGEIFKRCRLNGQAQVSNDTAQLIRKDGVVYAVDCVVTPIFDEQAKFSGAAFLVRDVTERRHNAETIAWQATHDPLTGTINRTEFEIRLKKLVRRAKDDDRHVHSLLYIDVDKFKFVNDSYGHAAGDSALKTLGDILRNRIRGADTLARVGGDEFTALLYSCSAEKARLIAESLRIAIEKHDFTWQAIELPISISIGIVEIDADCRGAAEIMRAADAACYSAKNLGRNRVHMFERNAGNGASQARIFDFVKDIQTAIHGNRLELFYQPLCPTGDKSSADQCELSVGVRDAGGELIPRSNLADLARRYQLEEDIDRWVIKAAIDALRLNHPTLTGMRRVLVPLSRQSVSDDRLLEYIVANLRENEDSGSRIGFVIDESGLAGHFDYLRYFVTALKQYDCQFMITDSGFGSESIDLLKSLGADFLGIRASLVQNILYNSVDYEVVLGLSRIGRSLGMQIVAEGADTRPISEALAKMGVGYVKGHLNEGPKPISIHSEAQWI